MTFLAVLELMKQNEILVEQEKNFAEIFVSAVEGVKNSGSRLIGKELVESLLFAAGDEGLTIETDF